MGKWVVIFTVLIGMTIGRAPSSRQVAATVLEPQFENALTSGNAKTLESMIADDATIVYLTPSSRKIESGQPGLYLTSSLWSKTDFLSNISSGFATLQNFEENDRKVTSSESNSVVTVRAKERVPSGAVCATICHFFGPYVDVYLTVVWAHTAAGSKVILCQTSLVNSAVDRSLFVDGPGFSSKPADPK